MIIDYATTQYLGAAILAEKTAAYYDEDGRATSLVTAQNCPHCPGWVGAFGTKPDLHIFSPRGSLLIDCRGELTIPPEELGLPFMQAERDWTNTAHVEIPPPA